MGNKTDKMNETIPDLKYRAFMLKLSHHLTSDDVEELKYLLAPVILDGKREKLLTPLNLLSYVENVGIVGPGKLGQLEKLLRIMDKHKLCDMVRRFIETES